MSDNHDLLEACKQGELKKVEEYLTGTGRWRSNLGECMVAAASQGHTRVVNHIMKRAPYSISHQELNLLWYIAAQNGQLSVCDYLTSGDY